MRFFVLFWLLFSVAFGDSLANASSSGRAFVLHRFDDAKHASTSITSKRLLEVFEYLKTHDYHVASLNELHEKLTLKKPIPDNWVWFTIDDSYKSFYTHGLKHFKAYNYPFILYVYIEATLKGYGDFMSWSELKEANKYGALGLHSYSHLHLTEATPLEVYRDTKKAYELFEKHLGFKPTSYAYPYGEYNTDVKDIIKAFNFTSIMNQNMGAISHLTPKDDIDRIALMNDSNYKSFLNIKHLNAQWNDVVIDAKTRTLKSIDVDIDPTITKIQCYVSGHTWKVLKVKEGKIHHTFDLPLNKGRTRVILKTYDNHYSSKIFIF